MIDTDKTLDVDLAWPDPARLWTDAVEYAIDAAQRSVLCWDALRQR
jgi:hypothetical protein